jgi:hypothetical protein
MSDFMSKRVFVQQLALHMLGNSNLNDIATKGRYTAAEVIKCVNDIEKHHPDFFAGVVAPEGTAFIPLETVPAAPAIIEPAVGGDTTGAAADIISDALLGR